MKHVIQIFVSFDQADESAREDRWNMSPVQRLEILEHLRALKYRDGTTAPRLQRLLEVIEQE